MFTGEDFDKALARQKVKDGFLVFEAWLSMQSKEFKEELEKEMKKYVQNYGKEKY